MAAAELLSAEGFRADGRRAAELRKVRARLGVFAQADGSAYLEQGNTKALAVVYGPHETRGSRSRAPHDRALLNCQLSMAAFSTSERKRRPRGARGPAELSLLLQQSLEGAVLTALYPRSQIDVFVQVLQADGGNYCACVNVATLALVDAGIPLRDYVCACSAGLAEAAALADLSYAEEAAGGPQAALALLPAAGRLAQLDAHGRLHGERLPALLEAAADGARAVHAVMDRAVRLHLRRAPALLRD
ncbi:exosome complex component RRP41 [Eudromia elegans]